MGKNKSSIASNGAFFRQLKDPFSNASKLGIFDKHKDFSGVREDVPDSEKRICIIRNNNGKGLLYMWVGHFPNKPEEYRMDFIEGKEIIFLIRIDVLQKASYRETLNELKKKIFLEYEKTKKVKNFQK